MKKTSLVLIQYKKWKVKQLLFNIIMLVCVGYWADRS